MLSYFCLFTLVVATSASFSAETLGKSQLFVDAGLAQSINYPYVRAAAEAEHAKQLYEYALSKSQNLGHYAEAMASDSSTCFIDGMGNCGINFLEEGIGETEKGAAGKVGQEKINAQYNEALRETEAAKKNWIQHENQATDVMDAFIESLEKSFKEDSPLYDKDDSALLEAHTGIKNKVRSGRRRRRRRRRRRSCGWACRRAREVKAAAQRTEQAGKAAARAAEHHGKRVAAQAEQAGKAAARAAEQHAKRVAEASSKAAAAAEQGAKKAAEAAKKAAEAAKKHAERVEQAAKAAAKAAEEGVKRAAAVAAQKLKEARELAERLAKAARDALKKAWNAIKKKFEDFGNKIKAKFNEINDSVSDMTKPVMKKIKHRVEEIKKFGKEKMAPAIVAALPPLQTMITEATKNLKSIGSCSEGWVDQEYPLPSSVKVSSEKKKIGSIGIPIPKVKFVKWKRKVCKRNYMQKVKDALSGALEASRKDWNTAAKTITNVFDKDSSFIEESTEYNSNHNLYVGCYQERAGSQEFEHTVPNKEGNVWDPVECSAACAKEIGKNYKYFSLSNNGQHCRCNRDYETDLARHPRLDHAQHDTPCGTKLNGKDSSYAVYRMNAKPCKGDYAMWYRMGGELSLSHVSIGASVGVAVGCDGSGHTFVLPTIDYSVGLAVKPALPSSPRDLKISVDYFSDVFGKPSAGAAWARFYGFGAGVSATINAFNFALATTLPSIDIPEPEERIMGKFPGTNKNIKFPVKIADPTKIVVNFPEIAGFGVSLSPTHLLKAAVGKSGLVKKIVEIMFGEARPDLNVGLDLGWVGFLKTENWYQLETNEKCLPIYNGKVLAELIQHDPVTSPISHFNELVKGVFPNWSPIPTL
jgi:hypothetical protein